MSEVAGDARRAGCLDDGPLVVCEFRPGIGVHDEVEGGEGLVPAREVVVADDPVEAEALVDRGHRELGGVDGSFLQCLEDLASRQHGDRGAGALDHQPAQPGEANLEASKIVQVVDGFAEPAGRLGADQSAQQDADAEARVEFFGQFTPATVIPPSRVLPGLHAEGHGSEQRRPRQLSLVIAEPRVAGVHLGVANGLGDAEWWHQLARLVDVEHDAAVAGGFDLLGDAQDVVAEGR